jgi:hypothetical protein
MPNLDIEVRHGTGTDAMWRRPYREDERLHYTSALVSGPKSAAVLPSFNVAR